MEGPFWQAAEDWHTAGEPFRIVKDLPVGALAIGLPVREQRKRAMDTQDHPLDILRRILCQEPRGHADMYGGFIVPPDDQGAHLGVLFFHCDGFSTACGHGTIALGHWAVEHGVVTPSNPNGSVDVVIDVPSGRVVARTCCRDGKAVHVDFVNVASYQLERQVLNVSLDGGDRTLDATISFGGAVYVSINAEKLGLEIATRNHQDFIRIQREIKAQLAGFRHQEVYEVYGVCFYSEVNDSPGLITQQNVVVFADGQIDRSPCGSGTAARVAVLLSEGRMNIDKVLVHRSILGTTFEARILSKVPSPTPFPGCIVSVRGKANLTGRHNFYIDPSEDGFPGFLIK